MFNNKKDYVLYELVDTEFAKKEKGDKIFVINPTDLLANPNNYKGKLLTVTSNNSYLYAIDDNGNKFKFNGVGNDVTYVEKEEKLKAYSSLNFFEKICRFNYIRYMLIQDIARANTEEDYQILNACFEYNITNQLKEKVKNIIKQ